MDIERWECRELKQACYYRHEMRWGVGTMEKTFGGARALLNTLFPYSSFELFTFVWELYLPQFRSTFVMLD